MKFTFHFDSIKTKEELINQFKELNLHFTLILLKRIGVCSAISSTIYLHFTLILLKRFVPHTYSRHIFYLHFTLILLKQAQRMPIIPTKNSFTFHFDSIKTKFLFSSSFHAVSFTFHFDSIKTSRQIR